MVEERFQETSTDVLVSIWQESLLVPFLYTFSMTRHNPQLPLHKLAVLPLSHESVSFTAESGFLLAVLSNVRSASPAKSTAATAKLFLITA